MSKERTPLGTGPFPDPISAGAGFLNQVFSKKDILKQGLEVTPFWVAHFEAFLDLMVPHLVTLLVTGPICVACCALGLRTRLPRWVVPRDDLRQATGVLGSDS